MDGQVKKSNFFEHQQQIESELRKKTAIIFLDYDGTLTPIVDSPDLAVLSTEMHSVLLELVKHFTVSVVSGRATDDVRSKVKIDNIFYAGSHGFEIVQPNGHVEINEEAKEIKTVVDRAFHDLNEMLKNVKGSLVEHVKYTVSVHYRLASDEDVPLIEAAVDKVLEQHKSLRRTNGKKVFEVRPCVEWDKGKAVEWILNVIEFNPEKSFAVYIGDDTTDEDAFSVLQDKGFGICVMDEDRETKAQYIIKDPSEVKKVLEFFIQHTST